MGKSGCKTALQSSYKNNEALCSVCKKCGREFVDMRNPKLQLRLHNKKCDGKLQATATCHNEASYDRAKQEISIGATEADAAWRLYDMRTYFALLAANS